MPTISDGSGTYSIGPDGEKRYATATLVSINNEPIYRFDIKTGILELSISEEDIPLLTEYLGGLPAKEIMLPSPIPSEANCHFHNVREIKSLAKKDGTFLIKMTKKKTSGDTLPPEKHTQNYPSSPTREKGKFRGLLSKLKTLLSF